MISDSGMESRIIYHMNPVVANEDLNRLFAASWPNHQESEFRSILERSLAYVCAYDREHLIGFVNLAWDGGIHAFLLDTTVHPDFQHQGIGTELVRQAVAAARARGIVWVHVDFEPHLMAFYRACGFVHTEAGLLRLRDERT